MNDKIDQTRKEQMTKLYQQHIVAAGISNNIVMDAINEIAPAGARVSLSSVRKWRTGERQPDAWMLDKVVSRFDGYYESPQQELFEWACGLLHTYQDWAGEK
jgi:hypothetical protein